MKKRFFADEVYCRAKLFLRIERNDRRHQETCCVNKKFFSHWL